MSRGALKASKLFQVRIKVTVSPSLKSEEKDTEEYGTHSHQHSSGTRVAIRKRKSGVILRGRDQNPQPIDGVFANARHFLAFCPAGSNCPSPRRSGHEYVVYFRSNVRDPFDSISRRRSVVDFRGCTSNGQECRLLSCQTSGSEWR